MSESEQRAQLEEVNLWRETWCRVESTLHQSWERTERRHYQSHLQTSPPLLSALTGGTGRSAARTERPPPVKLPERKHFEESYTSHLV